MGKVKLSRYYVYLHKHPETQAVVYVGKGTAGRAWSCSTSPNSKRGRGNRTSEHQSWIDTLLNSGYTPADFVEILAKGLSDEEARHLEQETTEEQRVTGSPLFNVMCYGVIKNAVLSNEQVRLAEDFRNQQNLSYVKIASKLGTNTMTIWRALNNKTKAYAALVGGIHV